MTEAAQHRQSAVIVHNGARGHEPYARLADGREMPMGYNMGKRYPIGTTGMAEYIVGPSSGLWHFEPDAVEDIPETVTAYVTACCWIADHVGRRTALLFRDEVIEQESAQVWNAAIDRLVDYAERQDPSRVNMPDGSTMPADGYYGRVRAAE